MIVIARIAVYLFTFLAIYATLNLERAERNQVGIVRNIFNSQIITRHSCNITLSIARSTLVH